MTPKSFDVLIVGGGSVGLTLALALSKDADLKVAVVEANQIKESWQHAHYSTRVSAITLSSQRILQALNVWQKIATKRISPFKQIKVWHESFSNDALQFKAEDIDAHTLGYIVENNLLQETLFDAVREKDNIHIIHEKVIGYEQRIDAACVTLSNQEQLLTKLMIGADGANSWLRNAANIDALCHDYEESALVATLQMEKPHAMIARQAFLASGPLGMLPLAESNLISIVWSQPKAVAEHLLTLDDAAFNQAFLKASNHALGNIVKVTDKKIFPLKKMQVKTYIDTRIALIGDAAHLVHPLAGQGLNMGLLDAAALRDVIVSNIKAGKDYASHQALRRYERWRKADNYFLTNGIDLIKATFESKNTLLQRSLHAGMRFLNATSIFRNIFTKHAVGNRTNLPILAHHAPFKVAGKSDFNLINEE